MNVHIIESEVLSRIIQRHALIIFGKIVRIVKNKELIYHLRF